MNMADYPLTLPPSPLSTFLQGPIPDLSKIRPGHPLWSLSYSARSEGSTGDSERDLYERAILLRDQTRFAEAIQTLDQAMSASLTAQNDRLCAEILAGYVTVHIEQGAYTEAEARIAQMPLFFRGEEADWIRALHDEISGRYAGKPLPAQREDFERALARYADLGDVPGQIRAHRALADWQSTDGYYLQALDHVDQAIGLCTESHTWDTLARLLLTAGLACRDQGYRNNVEDLLKLALQWCEFLGDIPTAIRSQIGLGFLYSFQLDSRDPANLHLPIETLRNAADEAERRGLPPLEVEANFCLAFTYNKVGDHANAAEYRARAEDTSKRSKADLIHPFEAAELKIADSRNDRMTRRLRDAIEGTLDPFFILDTLRLPNGEPGDFIREYRNAAANRILNCDPTDVRTFQELLQYPILTNIQPSLMDVLKNRIPIEDEICVADIDGEVRWYIRRVVPAGDGIALSLRDVTESRRVEERLRLAADRAQQADRAKSYFLANMSHEIRTPIHGVLGLARLLAESPLTETQQGYVTGIISSGDILLSVIGDVLDLSKIEAQAIQLEPSPVRISRLVRDIIHLFSGQASERGLTLEMTIDEAVPEVVRLDAARIRQILANLVGNGLKFTRNGKVSIHVELWDGQLAFRVVDTGVGIPKGRQKAIFQAFQQVNSGDTSKSGTGLGLTISKRLVELMGGEIGVSSSLGEGSEFYFRIPLEIAGGEASNDPIRYDSNRISFNGRHVLLAEDNPINVLLARNHLERLGFLVTVAEDGVVALRLMETFEFDLILMDVRMPNLDGLQATAEIRRREQVHGHRVPIIAITAGAFADEREECFDIGMDDYLGKPFTIESLRTTLCRWITCSAPDCC
jgi:signal transduction histidine kinase/CheY-like chemotaxis protein